MEAREYTSKLLEAVEEGMLSKDVVLQACLSYMSEDDVKDMCQYNCFDEYLPIDCEEEEEPVSDCALDLLDAELAKLNAGASLYGDADADLYVEVRSQAQSDIDAVRKLLERMNFEIKAERECEGSDYDAYYFFLHEEENDFPPTEVYVGFEEASDAGYEEGMTDDETEEILCNYLSNGYGFCVNGFQYKFEGQGFMVTDIDWDKTE